MHRYLNLHNIKPSFSVFQKIFEIIDFTGYCTILINRVSFSSLHITHVLVKIQVFKPAEVVILVMLTCCGHNFQSYIH